ncbi:LysR family transcriptional regulator [Burkholderia sp. Cy-637]|uniref:LysR family transcriptional regulator n=1 Tax=Burkholderia sp. Cy-637 TaxID=2608327 RepID=UPI0014240629|nr:LysR family transcriptional regulator [Burkholderia sp. Cy-637]NIF86930.1 LysR family transcriptional regulator [Burkholderia sp. Cy-637]
MDQLHAMRVYRCLVETRSFTAAAERLDTTHSTVSRQLKQLEARLGAQLLNRNSRHFALSAAGERYYAACVEILDRVEAAAEEVTEDDRRASGLLRVSMPLSVGTLEMPGWLPEFRREYPAIRLEVSCSDRFVNLIEEGFDVALRISGDLPDSDLVAKTLARSDEVLVASPGYIARRGLPRAPEDLPAHELLVYRGGGDAARWRLTAADGTTASVALDGQFGSDAITALYALTVEGNGIGAFTLHTVSADIARGRLVPILPGHRLAQRRYYALYPRSRHVPLKVRAFIDFISARYAEEPATPAAG